MKAILIFNLLLMISFSATAKSNKPIYFTDINSFAFRLPGKKECFKSIAPKLTKDKKRIRYKDLIKDEKIMSSCQWLEKGKNYYKLNKVKDEQLIWERVNLVRFAARKDKYACKSQDVIINSERLSPKNSFLGLYSFNRPELNPAYISVGYDGNKDHKLELDGSEFIRKVTRRKVTVPKSFFKNYPNLAPFNTVRLSIVENFKAKILPDAIETFRSDVSVLVKIKNKEFMTLINIESVRSTKEREARLGQVSLLDLNGDGGIDFILKDGEGRDYLIFTDNHKVIKKKILKDSYTGC
jgi:hypothetical protein